MSSVKFSRIVSVSSEDPKYPASNLLKPEISSGSWKCKNPGEAQAVVILQFESPAVISSVDIGNENSAFVELFVANSALPDIFVMLRVTSSLMSVQEAKKGLNRSSVRFFSSKEFAESTLDKSWDRMKVVCSQPFDKLTQYGLAFIKVHKKETVNSGPLGKFSLKKTDDGIAVGSWFAKRNDVSTVSTAAAIRSVSNNLTDDSVMEKLNTPPKRLNDLIPNSAQKDSKRTKFNAEQTKLDDDGRRSTEGPLLYAELPDEDEASFSKKFEKLNHTSSGSEKGVGTAILPNKLHQTQSDDKKLNSPTNGNSKRERILNNTKDKIKSPKASKNNKDANSPNTVPKRQTQHTDVQTKAPVIKNTDLPNSITPKRHAPDSLNVQTKSPVNNGPSLKDNIRRKPFYRLLDGVVFVLSGYQNPSRDDVRSKALKMGAKYKVDWDASCTHLLCAFKNTPKSKVVKGKGWIVSKEWIEDCFQQRKRLKCEKYKVDKSDPYTNINDVEILEESSDPGNEPSTSHARNRIEDMPNTSRIYNKDSESDEVLDTSQSKNVSDDVFDADTDIDEDIDDSE